MNMKLGHIGLPVKNLAKAKIFYDAIVSYVGLTFIKEHDDFVGYGNNDSYEFYLHTGKTAITGLHICFEVDSRELVQSFYDDALKVGGIDNGKPGIRKDYSPTYFAAFVLDFDGNNIEAVCKNE